MRQAISLMDNWIFRKKNNEIIVNLPHTWNAKDGQDGGNDYFRGFCVYRKKFLKPEFDIRTEAVYLEFDGVNSSAEVIVNGKIVTKHHGGYSTFRVDVTDKILTDNELEVLVSNEVNNEIYPQKADFTFYGGIYREVKLLIVSKKHFDLEYYGSDGLKVTPQLVDHIAEVTVDTYTNVINPIVRITILDQEDNIVDIENNSKQVFKIENPILWDGINNPYLYTAVAELLENEKVIDRVEKRFGIRSFYVDPKKGFFLNGRSYPLRGVSRHQDFIGLGNAIPKEQHLLDMELIKEVGANAIRLAHYQHDQYFYDLCDQVGMIVWAEIPYISEHMPNGRENVIHQMKELIVQNYHHASIVTWGLSNEITINIIDKKDMLDNHHILNDLCHNMDPTRPTSLSCYAMCGPFNPVAHISDLVGWNLYLGWYVPGLFLNDLWICLFHAVFPKRPLGFSEYGAEGMPNLHSAHPRRGDHTEDYQAKYHEFMLKCFERHPFLWSTFVWNMFDFAADARNQGGESGMNHKGLVTFDRKTKKDSFYLYKAWWSKEPFIYLARKRYQYRTEKVTDITVYTNQKEVSLFCNGKLIKTKNGEHVFRFKVQLENVNKFQVKSGLLTDEVIIYKTDRPKSEYKLKRGKSQNWV
jgi:beta-galactosidase